jgi:hypothetical protein
MVALRAAIGVGLVALAGLLGWQYLLPAGFDSPFGLNHTGAEPFARAFAIPHVSVGLGAYRATFRLLLIVVWGAYLATIVLAARGARLPSARSVLWLVAVTGFAIAVLWPPTFSCDLYGYIGYGRIASVYGLNPYRVAPDLLLERGDPVAPFLQWRITSPYGPLWTSLSVALAWLLGGAPILLQALVYKLIAAGALIATAIFGGRVAERLAPGRGLLASLAIGLNPLFLIEGAGNGHNDLVMMALFVVALDAMLRGRTRVAALLAGLAAAIKFLPLLLIPWILILGWQRRTGGWLERLRCGAADAAVALAPLVICYLPYWMGRGTFHGVSERLTNGQTTPAWWSSRDGLAVAASALVYVLATLSVARDARRALAAWLVVATVVFLAASGMWLPWYLSWIWIPALLRWDRWFATASGFAFCAAVLLTFWYSVPKPG